MVHIKKWAESYVTVTNKELKLEKERKQRARGFDLFFFKLNQSLRNWFENVEE